MMQRERRAEMQEGEPQGGGRIDGDWPGGRASELEAAPAATEWSWGRRLWSTWRNEAPMPAARRRRRLAAYRPPTLARIRGRAGLVAAYALGLGGFLMLVTNRLPERRRIGAARWVAGALLAGFTVAPRPTRVLATLVGAAAVADNLRRAWTAMKRRSH